MNRWKGGNIMPVIEVKMREQSFDVRKKLAERITEAIVEETGQPAHAVTVLFSVVNPDYVCAGGTMVNELLQKKD